MLDPNTKNYRSPIASDLLGILRLAAIVAGGLALAYWLEWLLRTVE